MRRIEPGSQRQCREMHPIVAAGTTSPLLKTVAQINCTLKNFSPVLPAVLLIVFALSAPESANAQASAPRMESDSRPSTPPTPTPTAANTPAVTSRTAKPSPTASGREVPPPQATASRITPTPASRPVTPNFGDARPVTPPTPPPSATPLPSTPLPRIKPTATPAKPPNATPSNTKPSPTPAAVVEPSKKFPKTVTKLMIDDLQNGRGRQAKPGAKLVVHFTSWLYDPTQPLGRGPQFETTHGKTPYKFTLQNPEALHIKGWEDGIVDMKTGGRRRLIIPPELGYGANGAGQVIPPGATLLYEIELIDVE